MLRISGAWEQTQCLLCLHHSFLGTQKFRDKGNFPTKGQQIQSVAGPELSVSNAVECLVCLSQVKTLGLECGKGIPQETWVHCGSLEADGSKGNERKKDRDEL